MTDILAKQKDGETENPSDERSRDAQVELILGRNQKEREETQPLLPDASEHIINTE